MMHYYYPEGSIRGGSDGLSIEISPEGGQTWLGTFAFGNITSRGITSGFTTPDSQKLCVVAKGQGYFVSANVPSHWELIHVHPILDVRLIPAQKLIAFADFTRIVAFGEDGIRWKTKRLTFDNMKITEVNDDFIRGEYWDIRRDAISRFVVDLKSGYQEGGVGNP